MLALISWRNIGACLLLCAAAAVSSSAQTFTTLHTFDHNDGALPYGTLVQGLDGNFYGTTSQGNGRNQCYGGCGTVFKITPGGALTTLIDFNKADGGYPLAGLVLGTDGNLYGSTSFEVNFFSVSPGGTVTLLSENGEGFGEAPAPTALVQNLLDGSFYGTSSSGGAARFGGVFSLTSRGTLNTIHSFCGASSCGGVAKGYDPQGPLIQGSDLYMYGTTEYGGQTSGGSDNVQGTIFKIGTSGVLTTLHTFLPAMDDAANPVGALAEGSDGNFYGTTISYGPDGLDGTVFRMSPSGELTILYPFCSLKDCADGAHPVAGVIQATDGNFYGTTENGGAFGFSDTSEGWGTVFQITPTGTLTVIHSFDVTDGTFPQAGLVQGTDGNLYGVATGVAGQDWGTVFKISMGLAPFVKTVPVAAYPGKQIFILGNNLTGATSVTFGGTAASFTVVSATEITDTVPVGSTTGTVVVTTPSGSLASNVPFRVF
jgi:uncharacterized repeat protein (TIGR03803 family)